MMLISDYFSENTHKSQIIFHADNKKEEVRNSKRGAVLNLIYAKLLRTLPPLFFITKIKRKRSNVHNEIEIYLKRKINCGITLHFMFLISEIPTP